MIWDLNKVIIIIIIVTMILHVKQRYLYWSVSDTIAQVDWISKIFLRAESQFESSPPWWDQQEITAGSVSPKGPAQTLHAA